MQILTSEQFPDDVQTAKIVDIFKAKFRDYLLYAQQHHPKLTSALIY